MSENFAPPPPPPASGTGEFFSDPTLEAPKELAPRHMSRPEAAQVLMELAASRDRTAREIDALEMGARRMMCRHFQRQRNWARRREAKKEGGEA